MAKYNTFVVYNCKGRKNLLVTSSARKARREMRVGIKVEVWNENMLKEVIYYKTRKKLEKHVRNEKKFIALRQAEAELRNKRRKEDGLQYEY
jgi:hypothetical protein